MKQALDSPCEDVFVFLTLPCEYRNYLGINHQNENGLLNFGKIFEGFLHLYSEQNWALINERISRAKYYARKYGKNLYVIRPQILHPHIGLLSISPEAILFHKEKERSFMRQYLENLEGHNLRYHDEAD